MAQTIKRMTRASLISAIANRNPDLDPGLVDKAVREVLDFMIDALSHGERIEIRRFGSFETRERTARTAHNPRTGKKVNLPSRRVVHFKPGSELKARVNRIKPNSSGDGLSCE